MPVMNSVASAPLFSVMKREMAADWADARNRFIDHTDVNFESGNQLSILSAAARVSFDFLQRAPVLMEGQRLSEIARRNSDRKRQKNVHQEVIII